MQRSYSSFFSVLSVGILLLSACNLPVSNQAAGVPSSTERPVNTATATIESTSTHTKVAHTPTPTLTATETPLPEPSETVTPEAPIAEVIRETNCRVGPAGNYDLVAKYAVGQKLELVARDLGAGYWFVKNPEKPEEQCYLLGQNVKVSGELSALPKITPPPSPTAAPYFSAALKKFDSCKGNDFVTFTVENTGSIPFRSAYIKVIDQKANKSVEQALNAFDLFAGCVLAKNIAPLDSGETGYLSSPPFQWAVNKDKLRAVLMLCTEKNLKGVCVTQTIAVKK